MKKTLQSIVTLGLVTALAACGGSDTRIDTNGDGSGGGGSSRAFATLNAEYSNILNPSQPIENLRYRCEARLLTGEAESLTTGTTTAAGEFTCDAGMSHVVFYLGQYPTEGDLSHYDIAATRLKPLENTNPNVITFTNLFASERSTNDQQVINAGRVLYPFETDDSFVIPDAAHATVNVTINTISSDIPFSTTDEDEFEAYYASMDGTITLKSEQESQALVNQIESAKRAGIYLSGLQSLVSANASDSAFLVYPGKLMFLATRDNQWLSSGGGDLISPKNDGTGGDEQNPYFVSSASNKLSLSGNGQLQNFVLPVISEGGNFTADFRGRLFESRVYQNAERYAEDFGESISFDEETDAGRWNSNNGIEDAQTRIDKTSVPQLKLTAAESLYPVVFNIDVQNGEETAQTIVSELTLIAEDDGNIYHDADSSCTVNEGDTLVGVQFSDATIEDIVYLRFELLMPRISINAIQGLSTITGALEEPRLVLNTGDFNVVEQTKSGSESKASWEDYQNESERGFIVSSENQPQCDIVSIL